MLLDFYEENRNLSTVEIQVRELCRAKLLLVLKERAAFWKQRGKQRAIREGDANTSFHHAHATLRMRRNCIRNIQVQGALVSNHGAKVESLTQHFKNIVGSPGHSCWDFDVYSLYQEATRPSADLVLQFNEGEAMRAVASMNRNGAPGPGGFGPSFYKASWPSIKTQIMDLLHNFHQENVELSRINRSYMVLIPKKADAVAVDAFRPISLQNCSIKIIAKILTQRLQRMIAKLIDGHQTGFMQGRSISESFVHAVELIQHCQGRRHSIQLTGKAS
jgi:hypothetical protein